MQILEVTHNARGNKVISQERGNSMAENTTKTAVKAPKKSWFKGMKSEFKKIIWPDKESLAKESVTVIVISAVLALVIALIDAAVKYGLGFII